MECVANACRQGRGRPCTRPECRTPTAAGKPTGWLARLRAWAAAFIH